MYECRAVFWCCKKKKRVRDFFSTWQSRVGCDGANSPLSREGFTVNKPNVASQKLFPSYFMDTCTSWSRHLTRRKRDPGSFWSGSRLEAGILRTGAINSCKVALEVVLFLRVGSIRLNFRKTSSPHFRSKTWTRKLLRRWPGNDQFTPLINFQATVEHRT